MTTLITRLTAICEGGNHLTFQVTGAASREIVMTLEELQSPIDDRDVEAFIKIMAKMAKQGRTIGQARTLLQTGVTVTV